MSSLLRELFWSSGRVNVPEKVKLVSDKFGMQMSCSPPAADRSGTASPFKAIPVKETVSPATAFTEICTVLRFGGNGDTTYVAVAAAKPVGVAVPVSSVEPSEENVTA
jgi:hypothetical protein